MDVPFDVENVFGSKRPRIKANIEGVLYRGTLVRMGGPDHMLIILKGIREQIGKTFGDEVKVILETDVELRRVEVPPDLKKALSREPAVKALFDKLSYTHRREYVNWINESKKEETRARRITQTIEILKKGKKERQS